MALTQTWVLQGASPTTIEATDYIHFSAGTFGSAMALNAYNGGTHVRSSVGADDSSANTPKNSKYLTASTVDIGSGSTALSGVTTANCPLKITVAFDSSITISDAILYAYDGSTTTNAPTGMTVQLAEQGDTNWTQAHGSGSALGLADKSTPATSHDYYVLISANVTAVGTKSANKVRLEFTYQ